MARRFSLTMRLQHDLDRAASFQQTCPLLRFCGDFGFLPPLKGAIKAAETRRSAVRAKIKMKIDRIRG